MKSSTSSGRRRLTAADRCDRCGARGYVLAVLAAGEPVLCGHHGRQFATTLAEAALVVHDESDQILAAA
ncbi:MAG TPA: hypothetical protein VFZ37_05145 [Jiangellaceae bacterium]